MPGTEVAGVFRGHRSTMDRGSRLWEEEEKACYRGPGPQSEVPMCKDEPFRVRTLPAGVSVLREFSVKRADKEFCDRLRRRLGSIFDSRVLLCPPCIFISHYITCPECWGKGE